jgi:hypothetical protein
MVVATPAAADNLLVDQIRASESIEISRGKTMEQVKRRHGQPQQVKGPIGEPPITRWVYSKFTVYFEQDRVIHAVAQR